VESVPRSFSPRERDIIRARLLDAAGEFLATQGIRKTSVEELARAAGISKGAFYIFFSSKEQLFFRVVKRFEEQFRATMLRDAVQDGRPPKSRLAHLLTTALSAWRDSPLSSHLGREEYDYLLRALPAEEVEAHLLDDEAFADRLVAELNREEIVVRTTPRLFTGLVRALFLLSLHQDEFGPGGSQEVMDAMIEMMAGYLVDAECSSRLEQEIHR
jgi:AcrR family transcriptional regulator